ncbi:acyl-CoA dehydrogenase family protein [Actinomadura rubrisoli]|nr:acyl-CoA dehydrogenase family protein [Actinomadura rubrisoli]
MSSGTVRPVTLETADILERVDKLGPAIGAAADTIERERRLPPDLLERLREAGVFRIAFPRAWGGPEMRLEDQIRMIESIARHDASAGWAVQILADSGFYAGQLPDDVAREIFPTIDLATAGAWIPPARAVPVPGGYRLTGRWPFGSGVRNADRVLCGAFVYVDGEPVRDADGEIREHLAFLPIEQVTLHDTWHTTGLAGSGSTDYSVDDVFVPEEHLFTLRYEGREGLPPLTRSADVLALNGLGVALGLTRHVLDDLLDLARTKVGTDGRPIREEYRVLAGYAEAEARLQAAHAYVYEVAGEFSDTLWAGGVLTPAQRARGVMAGVLTADLCRDAVLQALELVGSKAVFSSGPFDRPLRDLMTISRHIMHQRKSYEQAGKLLVQGAARHVFA